MMIRWVDGERREEKSHNQRAKDERRSCETKAKRWIRRERKGVAERAAERDGWWKVNTERRIKS